MSVVRPGPWLAASMRLLPRRTRFGAALLVARTIEPLVKHTRSQGAQREAHPDGAAETAVYVTLDRLTRRGIVFDPVLEITNYGAVLEAVAEKRGVLILAPHTMLLPLLFRRFYDDGLAPVGMHSTPHFPLFGTLLECDTLQPSKTLLLSVRSLLRRGRLVCGMPDRRKTREGRTIEVETSNGPVSVAPELFHVAVRTGARVLFTEVHVKRGRVFATIVTPFSQTGDGLIDEFIRFVRRHIESRPAASTSAGAAVS